MARGIKKSTRVILFATLLFFVGGFGAEAASVEFVSQALGEKLASLEESSGGRLGVVMLDTDGRMIVSYRETERFPLCSTFKVMLAAAVLKQNETEPGLLEQRISYSEDELVFWSPVTEKHRTTGMRVADLCVAAIQYSDNTAANVLLKLLGGPRALTDFARSLDDAAFRLDRRETALNEGLPDDEQDTTTPQSMAHSLWKLALCDVLSSPQQAKLLDWLKGNTTGNDCIRAGVPTDWIVGDKTGSGGYGTTNDIAILWPPEEKPLILVVYFTQGKPDAPARKDVIAAVARLLTAHYALGQLQSCQTVIDG